VLGGALTHVNTIGKVDTLKAGDYYVFSAGSGGKHAELNIEGEDTHIIYLWVLPGQLLTPPSYLRSRFDAANANRITCLVGEEKGALPIGQKLKVSRLVSDGGRRHLYRPASANGLYAFVLEGEAAIAGSVLQRRDSIALEREERVEIAAGAAGTDLLLVETQL
jgi:redox-sensitive bicupin YhaK (pirin superfamily)